MSIKAIRERRDAARQPHTPIEVLDPHLADFHAHCWEDIGTLLAVVEKAEGMRGLLQEWLIHDDLTREELASRTRVALKVMEPHK